MERIFAKHSYERWRKISKINHTYLVIEFVKRSSLQAVIVCGIIIERRSVLFIFSLWCCTFKVSERLGLLGNYFYSPKKTDFLRVWTYVTRKRYIVAYLMNYFNLKCFLGLDELFGSELNTKRKQTKQSKRTCERHGQCKIPRKDTFYPYGFNIYDC